MPVADTPRRVARIITRLNVGGPSIHAIDLARDLGASGFETRLIHGSISPGEGDMTQMVSMAGAEAVHVAALRRPIAFLDDILAWWRIYRELCAWRPDIVHTHMAKAGALGRLAALAYRRTSGGARPVRLIHTYHGHVFDGYFEGWKTRVFLTVERWLGRRTDVVIAISSQVRHDLLHTYGIVREDQIALIPLGFNLDRLAAITPEERTQAKVDLDIPAGALVVSTVGRLTAIKQHALFLEMAARLVRSSRRYVFLIVGDGELRGAIETRAAELGLGAHVRFLGWRRDLERIYGATDVFVLTSRNEGTPVALIEAMAAGVAPVSTDVGGVRDVITGEDVGILVPFGDADGLAAAVAGLADAPALREKLGRAGRAVVLERFHLQRLLDDTTRLYQRLLSSDDVVSVRDRIKEGL